MNDVNFVFHKSLASRRLGFAAIAFQAFVINTNVPSTSRLNLDIGICLEILVEDTSLLRSRLFITPSDGLDGTDSTRIEIGMYLQGKETELGSTIILIGTGTSLK